MMNDSYLSQNYLPIYIHFTAILTQTTTHHYTHFVDSLNVVEVSDDQAHRRDMCVARAQGPREARGARGARAGAEAFRWRAATGSATAGLAARRRPTAQPSNPRLPAHAHSTYSQHHTPQLPNSEYEMLISFNLE